LPVFLWPPALAAFLYGPFMALMPRGLVIWMGYALVASLLPLFWRRKISLQALPWRGIALIAAAVLYTLVSALWSPATSAMRAASGIALGAVTAFALFISLRALDEKEKTTLLGLFAVGYALGLGLFINELACNYPIYRWFGGLDPTHHIPENMPKRSAALFALLTWPLLAAISRHKSRAIVGIVGGIIACTLVFATNRSAVVGLSAGLVVWVLATQWPDLMRKMLLTGFGAALLLAVPVFLALPHIPSSLTEEFLPSVQQRMKIWTLTTRHVEDAPWLGHGLDSSKNLRTKITAADATSYLPEGEAVISAHPHNIFLQLWLDLGLAGVLLWGLVLGRAIIGIKKLGAATQPYALALGVTGLAMLCTTFSILEAWWASGYIVAALFMALLANRLSEKPCA
jgi:O-antigen ligase